MVVPDEVPYRLPKRVLDKTVAATLLVLTAPLLGAASAVMAADMLFSRRDRGPWMYRERRVSRGRVFDLLKFRTLRLEALESQAGLEGHARLLEADPDNLTWAGRMLLKRWYLDELPQLVNVLRGDMSLVGPRPWPVSMVETQVASGLDYRNRMIAGWTGPAQVRKGLTEPAGYTGLDLEYLETCRTSSASRLLRHDLSVLGRTLKIIARGEGLQY
jgi:lipopolysaccharide/colanic/teichoic acid biosynthesis glycosyltransferase